MTISLGNRAKMSTSTTGTGTITLGSAVSGFQTFADAGITNGQTVRYAIDDGANFEIGSGTYTSSGTTLTRSVTESSNSDSAISLSGSAEVFIAATVADLNPLYAANPSSATSPTASGTNAVAIGDNAVASGFASISIGKDSDSTNTNSIALGRLSQATGPNGSIAIGLYADSSGDGSVAIGSRDENNTAIATGETSVALGTARASGEDSFAAVITNNTSSYGATNSNSIAIGAGNVPSKASGFRSLATMGGTATAHDGIALGRGTTAAGSGSFATGYGCKTEASYSIAMGFYANSKVKGKFAFASRGSFGDSLNSIGEAQAGTFVLCSDTTDATPEAMTTDNSAAATDNQVVAASDTCIMFSGTIVAMQNGAQDQGGWEIKGLLKNDGGTTTLVNSNVQTFAEGNSWAVALSADNTNNALKVQVTGEAGHNIRWVANIQTSEVTYA